MTLGKMAAIVSLGLVLGCTKAARAKVADALAAVALEVCVEGDAVEVCARKCVEYCETRK